MTAPDVYLVAAQAAVAELQVCPEYAEVIATRAWFRAALDAGEAFRHPLDVLWPDPESNVRHPDTEAVRS